MGQMAFHSLDDSTWHLRLAIRHLLPFVLYVSMKYLVVSAGGFDKSLSTWPEIQVSRTDLKQEALAWASRVPGGAAVIEFPGDCEPRVVPKTELETN